MPFRATFDCLWCGDAYTCRGPDDLEGWAQLCSSCVGKAGDNGFLRFRLHQALTERGTAAAGHTPPAPAPTSVATADAGPSVAGTAEPAAPAEAAAPAATAAAATTERDAEMLAYYEARAPGIRRLVPASRPVRARPRPRRRLERRARRGRALAGRPADPRRDRGARGRHRLVVAAARRQGRAVALRRGIGPARSGTRAPGRASPAGAPARARRMGRAGPGGRRALHRVLAEPRAARPARRVPGHRPALAQARRDLRVHRLPPGSPVERDRPPDARRRRLRPPPRRRPRVHGRQGLLRAGRAGGRAGPGRVRRMPRSRPRGGSS